jgi:hypothetical protein
VEGVGLPIGLQYLLMCWVLIHQMNVLLPDYYSTVGIFLLNPTGLKRFFSVDKCGWKISAYTQVRANQK